MNKKIAKISLKLPPKGELREHKLNEVRYEFKSKSELPKLYQMYCDWCMDDFKRRQMEGKLLQEKYDLLKISPNEEDRLELLEEVKKLAEGMVTVNSNVELAWIITIDWNDYDDLFHFDFNLLEHFMTTFASSGLAKVLYAYSQSDISPFPKSSEPTEEEKVQEELKIKVQKKLEKQLDNEEESDDKDELEETDEALDEAVKMESAEILSIMTQGLEEQPTILSYRILSQYYNHLKEFETSLEVSRNGLQFCKQQTAQFSLKLDKSVEYLSVSLGTSYIYYETPKNFNKAIALFDKVLKSSPSNTTAQVGKGLILVEQGYLDDAKELLEKVSSAHPENTEALIELAWCEILMDQHEKGRKKLNECLKIVDGNDLFSREIRAKMWWRISRSYWNEHFDNNPDDENDLLLNKTFESLISSLRESNNYAPSYTALGIFYSDIAGDEQRASKCFYKALELDASEIDAAKRLVSSFADAKDWEFIQVLSERVISSNAFKNQSGPDSGWPYRMLGITSLNGSDYVKAIEYFQSAIRMDATDSNSWFGLGEAYCGCGKFDAALKVFNRSLLLKDDWHTKFMIGMVSRYIGEFENAIEIYEDICESRPEEKCLLMELITTLLASSDSLLEQGFFGRALEIANKATLIIEKAIKLENASHILWEKAGEVCRTFLTVQSKLESFPLENFINILKIKGPGIKDSEILIEITKDDEVSSDSILKKITEYSEYKSNWKLHRIVSMIYILCYKNNTRELAVINPSRNVLSLSWYNLALSELNVYHETGKSLKGYLDSAITAIKRSIQLENRNFQAWNVFGIAAIDVNPKVAQHCFIRALSLSSRQPLVWSNLATLYLSFGDVELALEAYQKAQTQDPEIANTWAGQAIISSINGNSTDSHHLFEHSYVMSKGTNKIPKLLYGLSAIEKNWGNSQSTLAVQELSSALVALNQYICFDSNSSIAYNVFGLEAERVKEYGSAIQLITQYTDDVESKYEEEQTDQLLAKYAIAKAQLARLNLGLKEYDNALEESQLVLDLLDDGNNDEDEKDSENTSELKKETKRCYLSALVTSGLAFYFLKDFSSALQQFRKVLVESDEAQAMIILLAQILWANGGEDEKQAALDELYANIEQSGSSISVVLLLGALSFVEGNDDLIEASAKELESLSLEELNTDSENNVQYLLSVLKKKLGSNELEPWLRAVMLWPNRFKAWTNINSNTALKIGSESEDIDANILADEYVNQGTFGANQRAIMLAPWNKNAWSSFQKVVKG